MQQAFNQFKKNIQDVKDLHLRYLHFAALHLADDLSDILRSEYVYAVSAIDRLVHELIRIGMLEVFNHDRTATSQYNSFKVSIGILQGIQDSRQQIEEDAKQIAYYIDELKKIEESEDQDQIQEIENYIEDLKKIKHKQPHEWFEEEIVRQHGFISFQDAGKISEGLNLISEIGYKWQKIATLMNLSSGDIVNGKPTIKDEIIIKKELNNIVKRRGAIVHEADADPLTHQKKNIDPADVKDIVDFIEKLGEAIYDLVKKKP